MREKFREYYKRAKIRVPGISSREFGIGDFGKKIVKRHMEFSSQENLNRFLQSEVPPFISYSAAYYENPSARPMQSKGFLGADLIYEFDADDIPTKCKEEHDEWQCKKCGASGKGAPQACSKCGAGVEVKQWFCGECVGETKKQSLKLIEVLERELGFREGIEANFSGKAGYHVHVRSEKAKGLSRNARTELIDYLTLNGFEPELHGFGNLVSQGESKKSALLKCPEPSKAKGLAGRFMKRLVSFIREWGPEMLAVHGNISKKQSSFLLKNKERILEKMGQGILFPVPAAKPETSQKFWKLLVDEAMRRETVSLNIDRQTSVDVHKILRVPGSIHGGTGLIAKRVPLEKLKEFDPFSEAVAFGSEPVKVFINKAPKFSIGGESFGSFKEAEEELPLAAAVRLIASGRAVLR